jgi:Ion channel
MTTVGYGDVYAVTTFGRLTSILTAMLGAVMISLLVATMSTQLRLSPIETKVINDI